MGGERAPKVPRVCMLDPFTSSTGTSNGPFHPHKSSLVLRPCSFSSRPSSSGSLSSAAVSETRTPTSSSTSILSTHELRNAATACQPRKDSWRWQTSNSEYGKFYVSIHREVVKKQEVHKDCSKTCENLSNDLQLAKAQLEKLKISCGRTLCNPDGPQGLACTAWPTSPKLGICECPTKPGPPSKDMYVTEMMNQFNGAQRHDPQMLLDHIHADHPHLVKRVGPKRPMSALKLGRHPQGDGAEEANAGSCIGKMGCGLGSRSGSGSGSPKSAKGSSGKRKVVHKSASSSKKQKAGGPVYEATSDLKHTAAGGANLTPTQRYNFYRYFGYAGQGAKTSRGWHSVKTPWIPTP